MNPTINAAKLYNEIKEVLRFMELAWHQMDQLTISVEGTLVTFIHGSTRITKDLG